MRQILKSALRKLLSKRDLALVRTNQVSAHLEFVYSTIRRLGIELVLDVGANIGQTGVELRSRGYNGRIVSFEPQPDAFEELQVRCAADRNWTCRQIALGAVNGTLQMHISGYSPSSSLLRIEKKHLEVWPDSAALRTENVVMNRLDDLAGELGVARYNTLLKIDVQGYESQVLAGASSCLRQVKAAYVELLFAPLYDGQSRYFNVMETLETAGLRFAGLFGTFSDPESGYALYSDGFFIRCADSAFNGAD
jgi:FkbM family methyltransferase